MFEVVLTVRKTHGHQQNRYRHDARAEWTECGGTAAGFIIQLVLRRAIAVEDIIESQDAFRSRYPGSENEQPGAAVKLKKK